MEQDLSPFNAIQSETSDNIPNNLDDSKNQSFEKDCRHDFNSALKPSLKLGKKGKFSNKFRSNTKKRLRLNKTNTILKRHSLSPEVSVSGELNDSNTEFPSPVGSKIDLYGSLLDKKGKMEVGERLSPIPSTQQNDPNESTLCPNDLTNDSNLCSDTAINDSMYSENVLNEEQMFTDTGMVESERINESQMYTNTSLDAVNEIDLNTSNNPEISTLNTNPSQGFDLLQNMHYDPNGANHRHSNPGNFVNNLEREGVTQVNQFGSPYMFQYNTNVQGENRNDYMGYNEDYASNVDYILNDGIDYVMESNYSNDNTNLDNNYNTSNVFINNLDNLTQSQDQLSNTHTVNNFTNPSDNMEDIVSMDGLSNDPEKELIRNNSINVLIENADKNLDEGVMSSILRDLICPICLEYFYFPVTVACGHTFCRYCIGHSKLSGKMCPLCRQPIGRSLNINTILSNLVKSLKLRKRGQATLTKPPDVSQVAEKVWWDEHCLKPFVSVPLFIRIMFGEIAQAPVFFDDLCSCLIDYFSTGNKWYKSKWVFTIEDFRLMRNSIGLQLPQSNPHSSRSNNSTSNINDINNVRIHHWVEDYLIANPQLCFRSDVMYPLTLKVYHDVNHKIEGTIFSAMDIPYKLPWDAGRHAKSLLHLPHSSVSLSHLIFAQCSNGQFGILDVGSTIGTMIKLQGVHVLQSGDRIHIGDKHEVDVHIYKDQIGNPFKDYKWDSNSNQVIDYNEYVNSTHNPNGSQPGSSSITVPSNASNGIVDSPEQDENLENKDQTLDVDMNNNLYDLDSYLKLRIFADLQVERDVWICPKGVILGRGPVTQSSYRKLSITTQNGYISREHCLIYYDGSRPSGSRWLLRDMSTLGTFLKLKPFQEPLPVAPGFVFKVGQCKVEVGSPHELSRRVPSSATLILSQLLHSHIEPFRLVELQSNSQNQVPLINTLNGNAAYTANALIEANRLDRESLSRLDRETYSRIDREQMISRQIGGVDLHLELDPNGQILPDSLRDDVL